MQTKFLVNLRSLTIDPAFDRPLRPKGYLAAPAYATAATRAFAVARSSGRSLLADNGRYDDVGRIASSFKDDADAVEAAVAALGLPSGGLVTWNALGQDGQTAVAALLAKLKQAIGNTQLDPLAQQLAFDPEAVVGVEDIWAACLLRLGLDIALIPRGRTSLRRRNLRVVSDATSVLASLTSGAGPGRFIAPRLASSATRSRQIWYLPVVSALDYDTAWDTGRVLAAAGMRGAALGFGAFLADDSYTNWYKRGGRFRRLPMRMPTRYLRTALVARGLWDGWASIGGAPERFHFLGLGAPIMLGIASLAGYSTKALTFDATSPIRDAVEGTLYQIDPAPLKVRTRRLAARLADQPTYQWPCKCPFCKTYLAAHPFDRAAARRWREANPDRPVEAKDLQSTAALGKALPLLSEPRGGAARRELDLARIGHNHWCVQKVLNAVNLNAGSREALVRHQNAVVAAYQSATNGKTFAAALGMALEIVAE